MAEEIEKSQPPVDLWRKFIYCTSLTGSILGSVDHMKPQGVTHLNNFYISTIGLVRLQKLDHKVYLSLHEIGRML